MKLEFTLAEEGEKKQKIMTKLNEQAREHYLECNIRGNLKMTKFHF